MPLNAHKYNDIYTGENLNRIAFPMGGMGAGMICLEGTGALSHVSLRGKPEVMNEPMMFAALSITGEKTISRVIEGPVPTWKAFGIPASGKQGVSLLHRATILQQLDQIGRLCLAQRVV